MARSIRSAIATTTCSLLFSGATFAAPVPIDLSSWTVVQYELFSQPNASWSLSNGNTTATQSVNADASILLSNFDITGQQIQGTWRVTTASDDDFMGFVFGYQNRSQFYLFDWKQLDQNDATTGFADAGMSVKVVNVAGGVDPTGRDLWSTAGTSNVELLQHNTIPWADFVEYGFRLNFTPGLFEIQVTQGMTVLETWLIADDTYTDGAFGFYNYSQGPVVYSGFTQDSDPPPLDTIPEPATLALAGIALAALAWRRRKRPA